MRFTTLWKENKANMARHNEVRLLGYISSDPAIQYRDMVNRKDPVRAMFVIHTLHGNREFGNDKRKRPDENIVLTMDPSRMDFIAHLKKFDVIQVKGSLTTAKTHPAITCEKCGHVWKADDEFTFVNPIFMDKIDASKELARFKKEFDADANENDEENSDAIAILLDKYLRKRIEISNNIAVIGTCSRDPQLYTERKNPITNYGLDIIRKYKIREFDPDNRHDYPNVKCYGNIAINDYKFVHKGSRVFIDGFIQQRAYWEDYECPECKAKGKRKRTITEIVPYSVEYLANCNDGYEDVNNKINKGDTDDE